MPGIQPSTVSCVMQERVAGSGRKGRKGCLMEDFQYRVEGVISKLVDTWEPGKIFSFLKSF